MFKTHNRKWNRRPQYDYSNPGYYFVTFCTQDRAQWFGEIRNGLMYVNTRGLFAHTQWKEIPKYYPDISIKEFVIMPDHVHGILNIRNDPVGTGYNPVPTRSITVSNQKHGRDHRYGMVSKIIKSYKHAVTRHVRLTGAIQFSWQRSFHDHIIRDERELQVIRQYITDNPKNWKQDNGEHI